MNPDYTLRAINASPLHAPYFSFYFRCLHDGRMTSRLLTAQEIGALLYRRRTELNLEVRELCERIDGLEPSAYYNYENGLRTPNKNNALLLARELKIPYGALMGDSSALRVEEESAPYLDPVHLARALDYVRTTRAEFGMPTDATLEAKAVISIYKKIVSDHSKGLTGAEESASELSRVSSGGSKNDRSERS